MSEEKLKSIKFQLERFGTINAEHKEFVLKLLDDAIDSCQPSAKEVELIMDKLDNICGDLEGLSNDEIVSAVHTEVDDYLEGIESQMEEGDTVPRISEEKVKKAVDENWF